MDIRRPMCWIALGFLLFISLLVQKLHFIPDEYDVFPEKLIKDGDGISFCGTVIDKYLKEGKTVIYLKNVSIDALQEENSHIGVIAYTDDDNSNLINRIPIGCRVYAEGKLYRFDTAENFGQFNSREYYYIRGYNARVVKCRIKSYLPSGWFYKVKEALWQLKESAINVYKNFFDDKDAGIMTAVILGDKTEIDPDLKNLYQLSGIAHILSLSGLHIATLGLAFLKLMLRIIRSVFGRSRLCSDLSSGGNKSLIAAGIIASTVMLLYCIMTGMSVSTIRALIMFVLGLLAMILRRSYDLLSAASFSSVCVVMINPLYIYDAGFQLSFMAVVSIGIVSPRIYALFSPLSENRIVNSLLLSVSIQLGTLPIVSYHYYQTSVLGIILNLIVVPLMSVVLIMGVIIAILGLTAPCGPIEVLIKVCSLITHVILALYEYLSSICAGVKWNIIITGRPKEIQIILYYCVILGIAVNIDRVICREKNITVSEITQFSIDQNSRRFKGHKVKFKKISKRLILCAFSMFSGVILLLGHDKPYSIRNLSVGQGDCSIITNKTHVIIVDCGSTTENKVGTYRLIPSLKANRNTYIDAIFISHFDADHVNGITELINDPIYMNRIGCFIISKAAPVYDKDTEAYRELTEFSITHDIPICEMSSFDSIVIGDSIITCLSPSEKLIDSGFYDDTNSASLVLSITDKISGRKCLLTGDMTLQTENEITSNGAYTLRDDFAGDGYDYLKVAHHGSNLSSSELFLDTVTGKNRTNSGRICVISVGRNNRYGHPGNETLGRLGLFYPSERILRTDINGEIIVNFR